MCHFLLVPYPHLCSGEGKKLRKCIVYFKLEQNFILMKEEKAFVDFIITGVLILSFCGFYLYKNVHDEEITLEYSNTTVNVRFSLFGKIWVHICYA